MLQMVHDVGVHASCEQVVVDSGAAHNAILLGQKYAGIGERRAHVQRRRQGSDLLRVCGLSEINSLEPLEMARDVVANEELSCRAKMHNVLV